MAANMIEEYTFRVEYLGSLMLNKAATGLAVVQKPLRELYLNNIRKSDQKLRAQERTIKVRPEGILMIFKDSSSGPPKHVFYEMSSIHFKDCVCFVTRRGSDKKIRGGFEPLDEHRKGSSDSFFSMLEKKHYFLAEKKHPALFVCIMRRPLGVKALDCHVFVMASHKEALQIVDIVNQLQFKGESLLTESSKTMPYNQAGNDKVTMYRPTENPSQQISGQRYELRDEFFRPQSYDQYMGDSRNQRGPLPDAIPNVRNDANVQQYGGVTVFRNRTDDYGRPGTYEREDVRMRHPVTRNQLNASFDDRRYLSANTSFDDDRRKPNGNLSFDENRRPFSMFQEPAYERHQEQPPPGYSQRFSNDDAVLGGRPVSGGGKINRTEAPPTNVVYRQQRHPHGKPVDSPNHDATVQELTSAFERENQKKKNMTSTPVTRPLSPTPKTAPKPDRTSGQLSPSGVGKTPSPLPSPGWGPVASMSNLESRQELERDKRASDPPPVEVQEDTSKTRPVAKVPPHLVAGVKVLPTEFKVPLRKTSPQTSPRCEDPNRYNNLAINSDFEDDYPLKAYQHSNNNNYNNRHNSDHQSHNRNSGGNYRGHVHPEIPYSHGPPINQSFQSDSSRDHGYSSYNVQNHRASDGDDWGYRDVSRGGPPAYSGPKGVRDPATGEIDDPPGSLKDKEIASLVSNIYIGQAPGANTNFEQSLGYYP